MITLPTSPSLALKLAWLVLHAERAVTSVCLNLPVGAAFTPTVVSELRQLIDDPEVAAWMDTFDPILLFPLLNLPHETSHGT